MLCSLITTIQEPTESVHRLLNALRGTSSPLIVIGDKKGPANFDVEGARFVPLEAQLKLEFEISRQLPTGHYSRKNVGYLIAIAERASSIYETDDDNAPLDLWRARCETIDARAVAGPGWINVFPAFTSLPIWPRGFPLDEIRASFDAGVHLSDAVNVRAPIQQGLANNSPDVDAIWRLVLDNYFE